MRIAKGLQPLVVPIDTIQADPDNVRQHSDRNLRAIKASLEAHGQQTPIVLDKEGKVLKGNGTLAAALALGAKTIAAVRFDGKDGRLYAVDDNRSAELAEWDWQGLAVQLREWDSAGVNLLEHGWEPWELGPLLQADWTPPAIKDHEDGTGPSADPSQDPIKLAQQDLDLLTTISERLGLVYDASNVHAWLTLVLQTVADGLGADG